MKAEWVTLTEDDTERTEMLRVPGGRFLRTIISRWDLKADEAVPVAVALAFQPDMQEGR